MFNFWSTLIYSVSSGAVMEMFKDSWSVTHQSSAN